MLLIPAFNILVTIFSLINSPASKITFLVSGSKIFLAEYLPKILSDRDSITELSLSSIKSCTSTPTMLPQSCSFTILS